MDAKKLKESIEAVRGAFAVEQLRPDLSTLIEAAEAHLATLPREVEVACWVVVSTEGRIDGFYSNPADAHGWKNHQVVRLTGTAVLPAT